jgi:hypothetical protein
MPLNVVGMTIDVRYEDAVTINLRLDDIRDVSWENPFKDRGSLASVKDSDGSDIGTTLGIGCAFKIGLSLAARVPRGRKLEEHREPQR